MNLDASIHFDLAINNFGIQEYMPHAEVVNEVFKTNYRYENGALTIDDSAGIGVDIDETAAERFPSAPPRYRLRASTTARRFTGKMSARADRGVLIFRA